jgi:hypothetical protein
MRLSTPGTCFQGFSFESSKLVPLLQVKTFMLVSATLHHRALKVEKQASREVRQKSEAKGKGKKIGPLLAVLAKTSPEKETKTDF